LFILLHSAILRKLNAQHHISGSYTTDYTYTCNPTTTTYTVTIPGSYLTESLHGARWKCGGPFGGESNTK
jgi:hypothetical protein